jgi:hypothetical protein
MLLLIEKEFAVMTIGDLMDQLDASCRVRY